MVRIREQYSTGDIQLCVCCRAPGQQEGDEVVLKQLERALPLMGDSNHSSVLLEVQQNRTQLV